MNGNLPPTSPGHEPAPATARIRRPRRAVATVLAALMVVAVVTTGLAVAPSGAAPAPVSADPADAVLLDRATPVATQPESGPQLTAAVWRQAIGTAVITVAATKLGAPYVYSAGGPNAFDCSGFVRWVWLQLGVELPHNSVAQWNVIDRIAMADLQPGDLVFDSVGGPPAHVALYVGDGVMIHAPNGGGVVRYDRVGWWTGASVSAGRVRVPA